uniref:Sulfotransferase n=1 Tax=Tetraselmis chuii TaxID=63592 RepID=A0A6U1KJH5_9CHLO|mmetsp:Transcript_4897/g.8869  ORF Transcript_4897/g.8869 Transcript_4897/m.8869 type:complete len:222 (+) Transcript_4897:349-1014(+)
MAPRTPNTRVVVWTAPRCVSTAFERCVMEIPNGQIFHEPYTSAYYFGPERTSRRYSSEDVDEHQSYSAVTARLTGQFYDKDYVFVKDMAYCVKGRYHMFVQEEGLASFKHTFLIRNPAKAILSLYKASVNSQLTGWDYFDEAEAGFTDMYDFYSTLTGAGREVVVVDCDDLLCDPEGMMKLYCDATGLAYRPGASYIPTRQFFLYKLISNLSILVRCQPIL